ncbi:hypothetical protein FLONG3_6305 [Fusarium longipes]|uniref:Apple domain-containing protein n=1 Tax=Fusarium longipes TaxID=694270 RepID=A0A395SMB0_9HYPO|nr:hypothetical protein FLONG3_6305 [Fusarium longipes]
MMFKTLALSCLALAPTVVYGSACKPRSTDVITAVSSFTTISSEIPQSTQPTSTLPSDVETTISSDVPSTTTSTAPCPRWTPITPYPADKVCGKAVYYDNSSTNPYYLMNDRKNNIDECAKFCGDTEECVSFYAFDYSPGVGAPVYKVCFLFKGYEEDIGFTQRQDDTPSYWEQGCFECVREEIPPIFT